MENKEELILIIDGQNMFIRGWIVIPQMSLNGDHVGAITGMMKMIQTCVKIINPTKIIVVWDGEGGSRKRKEINSLYKEGRKPPKVNRTIDYVSPEQERENRLWQQYKVVEYLGKLPILQLVETGVEADDLIAYLCHAHPEDRKVIVSSDKDFFQLIDDKTIVYRPISKEVTDLQAVIENWGIHPNNLALARAVEGDNSDNLKGVPRVGAKTLAKRFPDLINPEFKTVDYLEEHASKNKEKSKAYEAILNHLDVIKENYKIMQLYSPMLYPQAKRSVDECLAAFDGSYREQELRDLIFRDGIISLNIEYLLRFLRNITIAPNIRKKDIL